MYCLDAEGVPEFVASESHRWKGCEAFLFRCVSFLLPHVLPSLVQLEYAVLVRVFLWWDFHLNRSIARRSGGQRIHSRDDIDIVGKSLSKN